MTRAIQKLKIFHAERFAHNINKMISEVAVSSTSDFIEDSVSKDVIDKLKGAAFILEETIKNINQDLKQQESQEV